ncbi:MAG: histidine kinase [Chloroflexota bacterium]
MVSNKILSNHDLQVYQILLSAYDDDAVLILDCDANVVLAEGWLLRHLLSSLDTSRAQQLQDIAPPDFYELASEFMTDCHTSEQAEWRYYTSQHILHCIISTIRHIDEQNLFLLRIKDDTKELREYDKLRSDAERYRAIVEDNVELICRFTTDGVLTFVNGAMCNYTNKEASDLIGTSFYRLTTDTDVEQIHRAVKSLSVEQPNTILEMRFRSFGSTQQWVRWSLHAIADAGGNIAEIQSVGYDITDRVRAEIIEKRQRNLAEALRNIASVLNSTLDLTEVLENIIDIIHLVVRHDTVNVMLVEDAYATVVRSKGYADYNIKGIQSLKLRIRRINHLRYMKETQRELVIPNLEHHDSPCLDVPELCWVKSYAGAPIVSEGQVIGFLNLESFVPNFFEPEHGRLVRAFADHAATAIRNAQLYQQAQQIAVVEERQRLARELHDAVSQTLFSANMIADAIPLLFEHNPDAIPQQIKVLRQQTQLAMAELRAMLYELRPQSLADTDLETLLQQLIQAFANRTAMDISLTISTDELSALALEVKVALYRIAQEALNNAIQHANATKADISLTYEDNELCLCVIDNGHGFNPEKYESGHMGLRIMHERAESIQANLQITSSDGHGTTILVRQKL